MLCRRSFPGTCSRPTRRSASSSRTARHGAGALRALDRDGRQPPALHGPAARRARAARRRGRACGALPPAREALAERAVGALADAGTMRAERISAVIFVSSTGVRRAVDRRARRPPIRVVRVPATHPAGAARLRRRRRGVLARVRARRARSVGARARRERRAAVAAPAARGAVVHGAAERGAVRRRRRGGDPVERRRRRRGARHRQRAPARGRRGRPHPAVRDGLPARGVERPAAGDPRAGARARRPLRGRARRRRRRARVRGGAPARPRGARRGRGRPGGRSVAARGRLRRRGRTAATWCPRASTASSAALARRAPSADDVGAMLAFGTGVACEAAFLRWRSAPDVVAAGAG